MQNGMLFGRPWSAVGSWTVAAWYVGHSRRTGQIFLKGGLAGLDGFGPSGVDPLQCCQRNEWISLDLVENGGRQVQRPHPLTSQRIKKIFWCFYWTNPKTQTGNPENARVPPKLGFFLASLIFTHFECGKKKIVCNILRHFCDNFCSLWKTLLI